MIQFVIILILYFKNFNDFHWDAQVLSRLFCWNLRLCQLSMTWTVRQKEGQIWRLQIHFKDEWENNNRLNKAQCNIQGIFVKATESLTEHRSLIFSLLLQSWRGWTTADWMFSANILYFTHNDVWISFARGHWQTLNYPTGEGLIKLHSKVVEWQRKKQIKFNFNFCIHFCFSIF